MPGAGSRCAAAPNGSHRDATTAAATPSPAAGIATSVGATAPRTAAPDRVQPSIRTVRRSAAAVATSRPTTWPTSAMAASSEARPKASRQALSKRVTSRACRATSPRSTTSMSGRPLTRARPARKAARSADPCRSRTSALNGASPAVPSRFAR